MTPRLKALRGGLSGLLAFAAAVLAWAQQPAAGPAVAPPASEPGASAATPAGSTQRSWVGVPAVRTRLQAAELGLVINMADPYSVAVGEHYVRARRLQPQQVLRLRMPTAARLTRTEFEPLRQAIEQHFGPSTQALALAWAAPYAVECNSITGALALGFDAELCNNGCAASRSSGYFNSASARPLIEPGWRPSMLLAASSADQAMALIDRGVAADGSLRVAGRLPVSVLLLMGADRARGVRVALYPPGGLPPALGVDLRVAPDAALAGAQRVLMVAAGSDRLALEPPPHWVPGALADHLTSFGGDLQGAHGQSTVLSWIDSGATASHGAVSEPCNHPQKFPHPQVLLLHYMQGATAIEAYWKSVAWPQQSLFVGEPLAAPFAARAGAPRP